MKEKKNYTQKESNFGLWIPRQAPYQKANCKVRFGGKIFTYLGCKEQERGNYEMNSGSVSFLIGQETCIVTCIVPEVGSLSYLFV